MAMQWVRKTKFKTMLCHNLWLQHILQQILAANMFGFRLNIKLTM